MPAITGSEYVSRIDQQKANIWCNGEKIKGKVSEHPAFKGVIQTQSAMYDLQHDTDLKDMMTYRSPTTGNIVGASYMQPWTKEDLAKRREMIRSWARMSAGMLGRSPDYLNTILMAFASSAKLLEGKENCFPDHLTAFYEKAKEEDLSFTHTFINPQVNRSELYFELSDEPIAAKIIDENDEGIVVKGARLLATQGGITDEVLVFSPGGILDKANAFAFSIPSNAKGMKFICRESFSGGDSRFNYPLSSRFEEMDTIVVFDNVTVPWERVFFYKNLEVANSFKATSAFLPFTLHQAVCRQTVKAEFILGVAQALIETINISEYQNVQENGAEIIAALKTMEALLTKSETDAQPDEFGLMRPDADSLQAAICIFPKVYPRLTEIVQLLGSSGLITIPTNKDFGSEIRGDLDQYLQSASRNAEDRVKLFRLAWDLTMSPFGTRQTQYERFFFGNPVRLSSQLYFNYEKDSYVDWVSEFLRE
ncbi:4-hydroxyphenylacetate 3-monooxygenase, oxygenase component [Virgibacillus siamensis]|uniref:4-hydroxyphenylacetate 3-monooxygenase, oxygenase component n=1 Tax=Virgibacillus siamensis TaxID=480071 RepID=UPI0009856D03|nr:4-hydroxyphenylacetate 3-monooxygenase, oxygenase component [Virgibacillus siamensis]